MSFILSKALFSTFPRKRVQGCREQKLRWQYDSILEQVVRKLETREKFESDFQAPKFFIGALSSFHQMRIDMPVL